MSIERCAKHGRWDSDMQEWCPRCDAEMDMTNTSTPETAWLLERGGNEKPLEYLAVINVFFDWTTDPYKALRLARREDADALSGLIEDAERVVEHQWG